MNRLSLLLLTTLAATVMPSIYSCQGTPGQNAGTPAAKTPKAAINKGESASGATHHFDGDKKIIVQPGRTARAGARNNTTQFEPVEKLDKKELLPDRVLRTILIFAIESESNSPTIYGNLRKVCKRWNQIVTTTIKPLTTIDASKWTPEKFNKLQKAPLKKDTKQFHVVNTFIAPATINGNQLRGIAQKLPTITSLRLKNCTKLQPLDIENTCKELQLTELELDETPMNDNTILAIAKTCKGLKKISLSQNRQLTPKAFLELFGTIKNIVELDLGYTKVDNAALTVLAKQCSGLQKLTVTDCQNIFGTEELFFLPIGLRELYAGNTQLTDNGLEYITKSCPKMKIITVDSCKNLTDRGFTALATLKEVKIINLSDTHVSRIALEAIARTSKTITTLELHSCLNISQEEIDQLRTQYPNINFDYQNRNNADALL